VAWTVPPKGCRLRLHRCNPFKTKPFEAVVDGHLIEIKTHGAFEEEWELIIDNESVDRKKMSSFDIFNLHGSIETDSTPSPVLVRLNRRPTHTKCILEVRGKVVELGVRRGKRRGARRIWW